MRYVVTVLGLLLLVAALVGVKGKQISTLMAFGKQMEMAGPPPEAVSTSVAEDQAWEGVLTAVGSVAAAKGVAISNDAPGIVSRIHFESGALVKQGQVLVELDTNVERAQLASARARKEIAEISVKRSRALVQSGSIAQSQLDADESAIKSAAADVNALEAQIARKIVRAPFAGKLGIRAVNLGQYLSPGTTLTVLESTDTVYVDFTLPQQLLGSIQVGMPIRAVVEGSNAAPTEGKIAAIDPSVDAATRSIKLRATLPNEGDRLRSGMFVNVSVVLPKQPSKVIIPATAVVHAPYGDSVFIVEPKKDESGNPVTGTDGKPAQVVRQQFVRTAESRGDFVAIADGVKAGETVVSAGAFKLRNGSPIMINNEVGLHPELSPKTENR
jgi:membrane fusion protein (multidrug efflux system)